jgi:SAM-dependent methyltransferase
MSQTQSTHNQATVDTNAAYFDSNDSYREVQARLDCYRNINHTLARELKGVGDLLDVGSGGFFNYDTSVVGSVTAVDLFMGGKGIEPSPGVTHVEGSVLDLPFESGSFDCVLAQNLLHHVTGSDPAENHRNLHRSLSEMSRCVRPDGKLVIIESTVGPVFHTFETLVYTPLERIRKSGHPVTFQFTPQHIRDATAAAGMEIEDLVYIPRGRWLLHFGHVWPTLLTPARPIKLVARPSG